jgi:hypothetical protein
MKLYRQWKKVEQSTFQGNVSFDVSSMQVLDMVMCRQCVGTVESHLFRVKAEDVYVHRCYHGGKFKLPPLAEYPRRTMRTAVY